VRCGRGRGLSAGAYPPFRWRHRQWAGREAASLKDAFFPSMPRRRHPASHESPGATATKAPLSFFSKPRVDPWFGVAYGLTASRQFSKSCARTGCHSSESASIDIGLIRFVGEKDGIF
jgi:hypothetical protein